MAFEHRGFWITVDVAPNEADVQWRCRAAIQGIAGSTAAARVPDIELTIPKLKIDVLMALSLVEHRAVTAIDEWRSQHPGVA